MSLRTIATILSDLFESGVNKKSPLVRKYFGYLIGEARNGGHSPSQSLFNEIELFISTKKGREGFCQFRKSDLTNYSYSELMRYGSKVCFMHKPYFKHKES